MNRPFLALCVFFTSFNAVGSTSDPIAEGNAWWASVEKLADDRMEGRLTGSSAYDRAAHWVAGQMRDAGLHPAGAKGFFQPMDFAVRQIDESGSSLALVHEGRTEPLSLADDANIGLPMDLGESIVAPAVFVGHGLVIPEMGIDDLAGLDLRGKIAVFISGGSKSIPAPVKAHYSSLKQRWQFLKKAGAVGFATILNPKSGDVPWSRATLARLQPSMNLKDPRLNDAPGLKVYLRINPARADKFFVGTEHRIADLLSLADDDKPLPTFPLQTTIQARVVVKKSAAKSMNVAGILSGSDPQLKKEYVVLSAHLDHVGIGEPINGDKIYNGAMDNAAGVASLLQIAGWLAKSNPHPRRSLLFLAVTGEEKGLQGSKYFAHHPTVAWESIVANVNMDMFLPLFPLKIVRVYGLNESTLGDQMRSVCSTLGYQLQPDPEPDRNVFIRSDQYSFIQQGIPALVFGFGYASDSAEQRIFREWLTTRYHAPSDDLQQPVEKAAAAQYNQLVSRLLERIANDSEQPAWKPESFFRRFAMPPPASAGR